MPGGQAGPGPRRVASTTASESQDGDRFAAQDAGGLGDLERAGGRQGHGDAFGVGAGADGLGRAYGAEGVCLEVDEGLAGVECSGEFLLAGDGVGGECLHAVAAEVVAAFGGVSWARRALPTAEAWAASAPLGLYGWAGIRVVPVRPVHPPAPPHTIHPPSLPSGPTTRAGMAVATDG